MRAQLGLVLVLVAFLTGGMAAGAEEAFTQADAARALKQAVTFFDQRASINGAYVYRYTDDLQYREGEGRCTPTMAWIEPPGTPAVGESLLRAYQRTKADYLLQATERTAHALVTVQLVSGGWDDMIEFDPDKRKAFAYRVDGGKGKKNTTTLDDDKTQSVVRFLMKFDRERKFQDAAVHEAVTYALTKLLAAQYPNGAWPQRFSQPPDPRQYPVKRASYPDTWSRDWPKEKYTGFYTFNDDTIADTIATMLLAAEVYGEQKYLQAAEQAGSFILLAQMPDPQPAWAQQYDAEMHPVWARKFEPPAITGGESQGILKILLSLYRQTGNRRYLEPISPALKYLRKSEIAPGKLARFYELQTNKPLYFTKKYDLTYQPDDLPTHYGFIIDSRLDSIERQYRETLEKTWQAPGPTLKTESFRISSKLARNAQKAAEALDDRGAWVEAGTLRSRPEAKRVIESRTFIRNVDALSRYVAAR